MEGRTPCMKYSIVRFVKCCVMMDTASSEIVSAYGWTMQKPRRHECYVRTELLANQCSRYEAVQLQKPGTERSLMSLH
jgi:hypothetical protein